MSVTRNEFELKPSPKQSEGSNKPSAPNSTTWTKTKTPNVTTEAIHLESTQSLGPGTNSQHLTTVSWLLTLLHETITPHLVECLKCNRMTQDPLKSSEYSSPCNLWSTGEQMHVFPAARRFFPPNQPSFSIHHRFLHTNFHIRFRIFIWNLAGESSESKHRTNKAQLFCYGMRGRFFMLLPHWSASPLVGPLCA